MTPERWKQIEKLYHSVLDREPAQRDGFLQEACAGDKALYEEVQSLLSDEGEARNLFKTSALQAIAQETAKDSADSTVVAQSKAPSKIGQTVSHYRILEKLGEGGMGVVYKAQDVRLERKVALKFLSPYLSPDEEEKVRFIREAKAASALDHQNIGTIHEIAETEHGQLFIVMTYYEGRTLKQKIERGPLPVEEAVDIAVQIGKGLAKAHSQQIVHRDIKPGNILVTPERTVKIIDFGLAKLGGLTKITKSHTTMGTVAYISPEQVRGEEVDQQTDVWSLGVVLYEMLAGQLPFPGAHAEGIIHSILTAKPKPLKQLRADVPSEIERIVHRSLEKDLKSRYRSATEVLEDLTEYQSGLISPETRLGGWSLFSAWIKQKRIAIPGIILLLLLGSLLGWFFYRQAKVNWAGNVALPEIARLLAKENFDPAFRLARQAEPYISADPELLRLQHHYQARVSVRTDPAGAEVYVKGYLNLDASWIFLGKSPIENAHVPNGYIHWKVTKDGFEPVEGAFSSFISLREFKLHALGAAPPGMIWVPGGSLRVRGLPPAQSEGYWLDKYEVSNKQFKEFVDRGGYRKREYWKYPFVKDRKVLFWEQAMVEFRDATGRPGPSTWELGSYPEGRDDFPVNGVGWYEAAAYAEFAGKSLPTVYHWYKAAELTGFSDVLQLSNFGGQGPARAGSHQGLNAYGCYDMAGNVREWCWNQAGAALGARRYILGGAWNEAYYVFLHHNDAAFPFDRSAINGFRCARYTAPLAGALTAPLENVSRDYSKEKPVNNDIFRVYRSFYSYDRSDLKATVESADDSPRHWRRETVTFNAAYGSERVIAHLFLPKNGVPPYQTIIYFPGSGALVARSSDELEVRMIDFLLRSGRAVLYPVYKGMYERSLDPSSRDRMRDLVVYWSKDLGRSIDYLESRPDVDRERLAFYGLSLGGIYGPVLTAIDGRIKASVQLGGGFVQEELPPEIDPLHFAPRAKEPALIIVGRYDFMRPVETCQMPMFRLLGAPSKDKRLVLIDTGHLVLTSQAVIKEILDWLDRYLGPVKTTVASSP